MGCGGLSAGARATAGDYGPGHRHIHPNIYVRGPFEFALEIISSFFCLGPGTPFILSLLCR